MAFVLWLLSIISGSDINRLGSPDWWVRESSEQRLRWCGVLAVPELWRRIDDPDPERRFRVYRLLKPWLNYLDDLRAAALLLSPWPIDPFWLWQRDDLRWNMRRLALAAGVPQGIADDLVPDAQSWWGWFRPNFLCAAHAYEQCRLQLGVVPVGWPFKH